MIHSKFFLSLSTVMLTTMAVSSYGSNVGHVENSTVGEFLNATGGTLSLGGASVGYFSVAEPTAGQWLTLSGQSASAAYATLTGATFGFVDLRAISGATQAAGLDWDFSPPDPSPNFISGTVQNIPVATLAQNTQIYILAFNAGTYDSTPSNAFVGSTQWAAVAATTWLAPAGSNSASLLLNAVDTASELKVGTDNGANINMVAAPEPTSGMLAGLGIATLVGYRRRRQSRLSK